MSHCLTGIRVIDFTIAMAGPLASQRLGDMGADVVKVESLSGDLTRFFVLSDLKLDTETTCYLALNRNKKSVSVNLKQKEGLEIIHRLVRTADVVFENFRPGVTRRLGISYEDLVKINPKIIYASISGYGDEGPMRDAPGQDLLIQAFSGMTFSAGIESGPPHPAPTYFVDTCASHLATTGILAALYQRERTGFGQHVKTNLLSAAMEAQSQEIMTFLQTKKIAPRTSAPFASAWLDPPYGIYKTKDSWMALPQNNMQLIAQVVESMELQTHLAQRPTHEDAVLLGEWRTKTYNLLSEALIKNVTDVWIDRMTREKIWCGPVNTIEDLLNHAQSQYYISSFTHPRIGAIPSVAPGIIFSGADDPPMSPAPMLGEQTTEILQEIGFGDPQISALHERKVVR